MSCHAAVAIGCAVHTPDCSAAFILCNTQHSLLNVVSTVMVLCQSTKGCLCQLTQGCACAQSMLLVLWFDSSSWECALPKRVEGAAFQTRPLLSMKCIKLPMILYLYAGTAAAVAWLLFH